MLMSLFIKMKLKRKIIIIDDNPPHAVVYLSFYFIFKFNSTPKRSNYLIPFLIFKYIS